MTGFARRPLAVFVCCMFANAQVSHAVVAGVAGKIEPATQSTATIDLAALDDKPLKLRVERKFNLLSKKKPGPPAVVVVSAPVELKSDDSYPMFIVADHIEGRSEEETVATGNVELRKSDILMLGDKMTYWPLEDEIEAAGKVRMLQDGVEIDTPYLRMKMSEQIGFAEQVDYHVLKEVESKFYRPAMVVATSASTNATTSGAPMMSNVPNSYGLPTIGPLRRPSEGSGHAARADFEGENQVRLSDATYSTCKPGQPDWYLKASEIHLDYDEDVGEAKNASLWFKDVPIFYSPLASFSLNQNRKSGILHPFFSASTKNGFDFTVPYFWNIAPNYDVTFRRVLFRSLEYCAQLRRDVLPALHGQARLSVGGGCSVS